MLARLDDQKRIEVDGLDETDRAETGFVHCGTGLEFKETQPKICSLAVDSNHKFYNSCLLILTNTWASQKCQVLLLNIIIAQANLKCFEADLVAKVRKLEEDNLGWM